MDCLAIHILNVENGDCIILERKKYDRRSFALIDCNRTKSRRSPARDMLLRLGANELSFVCITHPDKDHYSGIFDVLTAFAGRIDLFYTFPISAIETDKGRVKKLAKQYQQLVERQDNEAITKAAQEFVQILRFASQNFLPERWLDVRGPHSRLVAGGEFADVEIIALQPPAKVKGDLFRSIEEGDFAIESQETNNALSAAFQVKFGGRSILLGGDATKENWNYLKRMMLAKMDTSIISDVVKLPHHGSRTDCDDEVIEMLCGEGTHALVSANGTTHPASSVLHKLKETKCVISCTNLATNWVSVGSVRSYFANNEIDPTLERLINEYGDTNVSVPQSCKGDICIRVEKSGEISLDTQYNTRCLCDVDFL